MGRNRTIFAMLLLLLAAVPTLAAERTEQAEPVESPPSLAEQAKRDERAARAQRFQRAAQARNADASIRPLQVAVIDDPDYEDAWSELEAYATGMGRGWNRVYVDKRAVTAEADHTRNKKTFTISMAASDASEAESGDAVCWIAYGMAKAKARDGILIEVDVAGEIVEHKVNPKTMTALDIEREAVLRALDEAHALPPRGAPSNDGFWAMMARAEETGFLDEAIFLHMLDERLAAEYPAFREEHGARLVAYLDRVIAPRGMRDGVASTQPRRRK